MNRTIVVLLLIAYGSLGFGQSDKSYKIPEELLSRKEIYVEFAIDKTKEAKPALDALNRIISISDFNPVTNMVKAYVSINNYKEFIDSQHVFKILTPPSMLLGRSDLDKNERKNTNDWDYYPNYQQYLDMMQQFETDYPDLCELVNIGQTNEGRDILFIHISDKLGRDLAEPEFMFTSSMHGDEIAGYVLMLRFIDYLLSNYGTLGEITNLVDNVDIWINPLANPDGTFAGGDNSVFGATRFNSNGVDLNRNYSDPEDGPHPDGNPYQVETELFMDFASDHDFVMSANFHGGSEVVNYPWDTWAKLAADNNWWEMVSREYADTVHLYNANYMTDLDNGVTNGYQWYTISGGRQDYMNYFQHCREVTIELSTTKLPPGNQLPSFWIYNYRSLINYMEEVLNGLKGVVTNASNGNTVKAKVFADSHDIDESFVYSRASDGNYNRLLKEGTYSITFSALGYYDKTFPAVQISDFQSTILDVQLDPLVSVGETNNITAKIYPNPTTDVVNVSFPIKDVYHLSLIDNRGKTLLSKTVDEQNYKMNLAGFSAGKYIISIKNSKGESFVVHLVVN
ncbi:MAG: T9SS type A sorting domain-containing protein [Chlorobi bacterium]|nr:T9SS type A sorting domain-containing protein [Chlorobiota bacterium]